MNRCPITYEVCENSRYSKQGLQLISKKIKNLHDFSLSASQQIQLAVQMAAKLSIQGMQPKLSIRLNTSKELFEAVERGGTYILKPPHDHYKELPQNEDLTMKLATLVGINVPFHGMIFNTDESLSYFIKRFDRIGRNKKVAVEDFSQLMGCSRDTKYESSMEQVIRVVEKHCTFPNIEKLKLFRLIIFNFLTGNEDMHLKNFTLIRCQDKVEFSPFYDLLNTTIVLFSKEEIALPIRGKKSRLKRNDLIEYLGMERLGISKEIINLELNQFNECLIKFKALIKESFLSQEMKKSYLELLQSRVIRLEL